MQLVTATRNLKRLVSQTEQMGKSNDKERLAKTLVENLPLSNGISAGSFEKICRAKKLIPQADLIAQGVIKPKKKPTHEEEMGTDNAVFLFMGPFSYPNTHCGILFRQNIQTAYGDNIDATPFDSGGLMSVFGLPAGSTSREVFETHLLPVPGHESLLKTSLVYLFDDPLDYISGIAPVHQGPVPLTGGDRRRWTHEVRINSQVAIDDYDRVEAVFVTREKMNSADIEEFLTDCRDNGIVVVRVDASMNQAFTVMQQECIQYIEEKIGV